MKTGSARVKGNGGIVRGIDKPYTQMYVLDVIAGVALLFVAFVFTFFGVLEEMGAGGIFIIVLLYGFGIALLIVPPLINVQRR